MDRCGVWIDMAPDLRAFSHSLVTIDARSDVHRSDFGCRRQLPNLRQTRCAPLQRPQRWGVARYACIVFAE